MSPLAHRAIGLGMMALGVLCLVVGTVITIRGGRVRGMVAFGMAAGFGLALIGLGVADGFVTATYMRR